MDLRIILLLNCLAMSTCQAPEQDLSELSWLLGNWERTDLPEGSTGLERWSRTTHQEYQGVGLTLRGKDTVFVEHLSLFVAGRKIYYAADVRENPEPVWFELTETSPGKVVFENPGHDFPKVITYQLGASDTLHVRISDASRAVDFYFAKGTQH